jgi:hypothetical protein
VPASVSSEELTSDIMWYHAVVDTERVVGSSGDRVRSGSQAATSGRLSTLPSQCTLFTEEPRVVLDVVAKVANSAPLRQHAPHTLCRGIEVVNLYPLLTFRRK